jgi:tripartite-type tricarboxylate transporter receptor subunit TctC
MNMQRHAAVLALAAAAGAITLSGAPVHAQDAAYPSRLIRYVLPMPPGGPNDFLARLLAERLTKSLGQPVIVENRPGADSMVGTEYAARQPADGYTVLHVASSHVTNVIFKADLPYDPIRDFDPVTQLVGMKFILAATPALGVDSVKEFVAHARANPGKITYATLGVGSSHFLAGEMLKSMAGISMLHVPYKGGAQITQALLGREVDATFISIFPVRKFIQSGKLRGLGVTSSTRSSLLPEVPTIAEAGPFPGYEMDVWQGVVLRAGTPKPMVTRLNRDIVAVLKNPEDAARITASGVDPVGSTPEQFVQLMKADLAKWAKVAKDAGIKPQ